MYTIFTDTDTDITPQIAQKYGYHLISMPYSIDGETTYPYEDFDVFECHAFYDKLRGGVLPTTSAISEEKYISYFEPEFAAGHDILYVHFSAAMTVTFDVMHAALAKLAVKYPERKLYEIDTLGISIISLAMVEDVGQMYLDGKSPEEIIAWADVAVQKFGMYFFADDLKFFRRSGRVSGLAATMGTVLGVRPLIYMSPEGKMVSIGKERGRIRAMERLVAYVEELGDGVKEHTVIVGHTDAPDLAEEVAAMLRGKFGDDLDVVFMPVNPTAGSHCGPDGVGISFHAKHR